MVDRINIDEFCRYINRAAAKLGMSPEELVEAILDAMCLEGLISSIVNEIVLKEPSCVRDKRWRIKLAISHVINFGLAFYQRAVRPALEELECLGHCYLEDPGTLTIDDEGGVKMGLLVLRDSPLRMVDQVFLSAYPDGTPHFLQVRACVSLNSEEEIERLKANVKRVNEEIFAETDFDYLYAEIVDVMEEDGEIWVTLAVTAQGEYLPSVKWLDEIIDKEIVAKSKQTS